MHHVAKLNVAGWGRRGGRITDGDQTLTTALFRATYLKNP